MQNVTQTFLSVLCTDKNVCVTFKIFIYKNRAVEYHDTMVNEISKYQPGDAVKAQVLRGSKKETHLAMKNNKHYTLTCSFSFILHQILLK